MNIHFSFAQYLCKISSHFYSPFTISINRSREYAPG